MQHVINGTLSTLVISTTDVKLTHYLYYTLLPITQEMLSIFTVAGGLATGYHQPAETLVASFCTQFNELPDGDQAACASRL